MGRDVDTSWVEDAVERYQRVQRLQADFTKALARCEVTVRSPDGLVEVLVTADGVIRDVVISEAAHGRPVRDLSRSVRAAVTAAAEAASWARAKLHQETFRDCLQLATSGRTAP